MRAHPLGQLHILPRRHRLAPHLQLGGAVAGVHDALAIALHRPSRIHVQLPPAELVALHVQAPSQHANALQCRRKQPHRFHARASNHISRISFIVGLGDASAATALSATSSSMGMGITVPMSSVPHM